MPLMVPPWDRLSPGGSEPPATAQEYGDRPPVAESVAEYGTPIVPMLTPVVVTDGGAASVAIVAPKSEAAPAATQLAAVAQDTPNNDATSEGAGWLDQLPPPSDVLAIVGPPTTVQDD